MKLQKNFYSVSDFEMMKMNKRKRKKILKIGFRVFLGLTVIFYLTVSIAENNITTESVKTVNFSDDVNSEGFVVRDEEVIDVSGYKNFDNIMLNFKNGEKVSKGSVLAKVYDSQKDKENAYVSSDLDEKVSKLENKSFSYMNIESASFNKKVDSAIMDLMFSKSIEDKDKSTQKLWEALDKEKKVSQGKKYDLGGRIKDLKNAKNEVSVPGDAKSVVANSCGEYIAELDGFENSLKYSELPGTLNVSEINPTGVNENSIGKIVKNDTWYAVFNISEEEAYKIKKGKDFTLSIDGKDYVQNIPCEVKSLKFDSASGKYTLIISCDYMNEYFASLRKEKFRISSGMYPGIKIPKSAIHEVNSEFGVYVKHAGYLKFKKVDIYLSRDDFVIVKYGDDYYDNENYIQNGDKMVVDGKNLYVGKRVK